MTTADTVTVRKDTGGNPYTVSHRVHIDRDSGSIYWSWECTCPARGACRHIDKVVDERWAAAQADADYDAMDVMERELL